MGIEHNFNSDPFAHLGYWAPQTSQANFCEEDYTVTLYVAEFVNSLTNLAYVYYALTTLPPTQRSHSSLLAFNSNTMPNLALLSVGISSLLFHMTLKHTTQLCDDLSMFWVCAAIIYKLYTPDLTSSLKATLATGLVGALLCVSVLHICYDVLWLHSLTFAVLVTAIWPRTLWLIRSRLRGKEKRDAGRLFRTGGVCFLLGFALWLVDGAVCVWLRKTRGQIGLPWAWVLEFHGWWHILTAIGAGRFVVLAETVTRARKSEQEQQRKKNS